MTRTPIRFVNALFWPLTIWTSFNHIDEHPADDYVERTSPIVALAIGFWVGLAAWIGLRLSSDDGQLFSSGGDVANTGFAALADVIVFFLPVLYAIGFWLFTARDERYRN